MNTARASQGAAGKTQQWIVEASQRAETGSDAARRLRRAGMLPAVVYGRGEPLPITLEAHGVSRLIQRMHGENRLLTLRLRNAEEQTEERLVLLKEAQLSPLKGQPLHLDFLEVDPQRTVALTVELHPLGQPAGELHGGVLQAVRHDLRISCLPKDIPPYLEVDVSALLIGHSLHIRDIQLPPGVSLITPAEETIFVLVAPLTEAEETETQAESSAEAAAE